MNFLIVLVLALFSFQTSPIVDDVRNHFPEISSEEQADNFIKQLNKEDLPEAKAYIAAMNFMKSRFIKWPFTKMKYFKIGKNDLDDVILSNPKNVEMRYIRYLMQKQIPDFLGYNKNIIEDFNSIVSQLEKANLKQAFKLKIISNMLLVSDLTDSEKKILTNLETNI